MNSGQEDVIHVAVRDERTVKGGLEVTNKTLIASTDEGAIPQPLPQAWTVHTTTIAPIGPPPSPPPDVRKNSWSNRIEDFCCLYDINSRWYKLEGKGIWCVLFLLLAYLVMAVFILVVWILHCLVNIMRSLPKTQARSSRVALCS